LALAKTMGRVFPAWTFLLHKEMNVVSNYFDIISYYVLENTWRKMHVGDFADKRVQRKG
jgi:hypothetical protein